MANSHHVLNLVKFSNVKTENSIQISGVNVIITGSEKDINKFVKDTLKQIPDFLINEGLKYNFNNFGYLFDNDLLSSKCFCAILSKLTNDNGDNLIVLGNGFFTLNKATSNFNYVEKKNETKLPNDESQKGSGKAEEGKEGEEGKSEEGEVGNVTGTEGNEDNTGNDEKENDGKEENLSSKEESGTTVTNTSTTSTDKQSGKVETKKVVAKKTTKKSPIKKK